MTAVDLVVCIDVDPIDQGLAVVRLIQEDRVVVDRYSIAVDLVVEDTDRD